jgi:ATP-dependent exoDNAse (exonuclease V) beta subunit
LSLLRATIVLSQGEVTLSTKTPNAEQLIAIEKKGGVLLSAGAGSGKTFVIIEHIVFLLEDIRTQHSFEYLTHNIMNILSGITLMTFTKKATGEMSIRLTKRIEELLLQADGAAKKFWELVYQNLSSLKILTIHGLCHHLLRSGFWADFPIDIDLLDKMAHKQKIKKLFDQWYEINIDHLKPQFLAHTQELFIAIEEIFLSPELRILWETPRNFDNRQIVLDSFFDEWCSLRKFEILFSSHFSYTSDKKKSAKKGFQAIEAFSNVAEKYGNLKSDNFKNYFVFFKELGRFPPTSKDMSAEELAYRMEMKVLHEDIKIWGEDLLELEKHFEAYQEWANTLLSVFKYINLHYQDLPGFSFADLEYYVFRGLDNTEVLKKIHESYHYFIVDEFQDTSFTQFDIFKKLIGNDFLKLYVVGDRKQAIYGFRGGELQVFQDCEHLMATDGKLALLSNYRSKKNIVQFNNQFFLKIFPLGFKYEDLDAHATEMELQLIPESNKQETGEVYALQVNLSSIELDLDICEAVVLANEIEMLIEDASISNICVLYRKLRPSYLLIDILKKKGLSFVAQIKISFSDDPLISFFKLLVENVLNNNDLLQKQSSFFKLTTLCEVLDIDSIKQSHVDDFIQNSKILGITNAFMKLFLTLGLTNSFYDQNLKLIYSICDIGQNDFLQIFHLLKDNDDEYSTELVSGKKCKTITLMTAHASKGLEFDAVLLGGVHTNGGYQGMKGKIGKLPGSFRWKKSYDQNKFSKSPAYFIESEILKQKNFSESKRLLYVACTRAISKLCWVDLISDGEQLISDQNSWIKALRLSDVQAKEIKLNQDDPLLVPQASVSFIQKDSLGLSVNETPTINGITSELSVTRLATLAECPFKFYLKNICKINLEEKFYTESEDELEDETPVFYSSKERGTAIHLILSKMFKGDLDPARIPNDLCEIVAWVQQLASVYSEFSCISEVPIKFEFFHNMISGTPDLVFIDKNFTKVVVWDFKTGNRYDENEASYWFQLMCYAYGIGKIYPLGTEAEIEINLIYIDEKKNVSQKRSLSEISRELFSVWNKTESLYQVNLKHCPVCEFASICKKILP